MPIYDGEDRSLFLSKSQELCGMFAHRVAVTPKITRVPEAIEEPEQDVRIVGRLADRFRSFEEQACPLDRGRRLMRCRASAAH